MERKSEKRTRKCSNKPVIEDIFLKKLNLVNISVVCVLPKRMFAQIFWCRFEDESQLGYLDFPSDESSANEKIDKSNLVEQNKPRSL